MMFRPAARLRPPTVAAVPALLVRLLPRYLWHFAVRPYRDGWRASPVRRHQTAVYDAVLDIMLRGYAELAGHRLRPETGRVAVALMRIGFAFDDESERREVAGEALAFDDVFRAEPVQRRVREWRDLMVAFDNYDAIRQFLVGHVRGYYQAYRGDDLPADAGPADPTTEEPPPGGEFGRVLVRGVRESSGLLVTLVHVVARLHGTEPSVETLREFSSLGATAKLADDIIDFGSDVAGGHPNLLQVLVREHGEEAAAAPAVTPGRCRPVRWWRRHCPLTYERLLTVYGPYEARLTSPRLRFASRLMWTPAVLGHARRVETRGRI
jgi:hypothetical protein